MRNRFGVAALAVALAMPGAASASLSQLSGLFVFGDSLSDGGNSGLASQDYAGPGVVFPPPPYSNGRYSNGLVAVEHLWNSFNPGNTSFKPSLAGGTNYAIGGATTGSASYNTITDTVPDVLKPAYQDKSNAWELAAFASQAPVFNPATSLFVVWLFPNDVFYAADTLALPGTVPSSPGGPNVVANGLANIQTTIQTLALAGARHFLVPNMPDLGIIPAFLGKPDAPVLSGLTDIFNGQLQLLLDGLDQGLPGVDIVQFDTAGAFKRIAADPKAYGFEVADKACLANLANQQCDPSTWVFWDDVHPTTRTHEVLAGQWRAALVPEPPTYMMVVLALGLAGAMTRRRRPGA
jgi:phospholipase/lecithinase/hemolysin